MQTRVLYTLVTLLALLLGLMIGRETVRDSGIHACELGLAACTARVEQWKEWLAASHQGGQGPVATKR